MNFQTMNKQRKFILIAAAVGVISLFLPWINVGGFGSVSGFGTGGLSYLVLIGFIAAGIVCIMGTQTLPLEKTFWFVALAGGGIAAILLIINLLRALDVISYLGFGFYLALIASLAVVYFAWQFRKPGDDIRSGFDSLKKDFNKQVNSGSTTTNTTTTNTGNPSSTNMGNTSSGNITTTPTDPITGL